METYHTRIPVWQRYVDDTFVMIPEDLVDDFHAHLNSVEKTIKFTKGVKKEGRLSFLDVTVSREETGAIKTKVYRKSIHTG